MKKIKRKNDHCLNCGARFDEEINFCPECGQQNTDQNVSILTLISEFFQNYFSLDSRFVRTFVPFLFRPGKITRDFLDGKRLTYANPVRWYLVISLVHFIVFNQLEKTNQTDNESIGIVNIDESQSTIEERLDSLHRLPDSIKYKKDDNLLDMSSYEMTALIAMSKSKKFTNSEIYDSLKIARKPTLSKAIATVIIKSTNSSSNTINGYILEKIPVIVFFLLPLYGLLLKLFYFKRGLYIKHLIHSLHIHSFLFFVLSIGWIISLLLTGIIEPIIMTGLGLTTLYIIRSSKTLYDQTYPVVIFKTLAIGIVYLFLVTLFFVIGILLSILLM